MTQADWNFYSNAEFCNVCYGNLYRDNERDETPLFDEGTGLCLRQAHRECAQKLPMQNKENLPKLYCSRSIYNEICLICGKPSKIFALHALPLQV